MDPSRLSLRFFPLWSGCSSLLCHHNTSQPWIQLYAEPTSLYSKTDTVSEAHRPLLRYDVQSSRQELVITLLSEVMENPLCKLILHTSFPCQDRWMLLSFETPWQTQSFWVCNCINELAYLLLSQECKPQKNRNLGVGGGLFVHWNIQVPKRMPNT